MSTIKVDAIKNSSGQSEISVTTLKADTIQNTSGASVIKVDTLQTTSGAGLYPARAWVNFNGSGTVAIVNSANVSSLTDVSTGKYTVNYTTAVPVAVHSTVMSGVGSTFSMQANCTPIDGTASTTTSASVGTGNTINAAFIDFTYINFVALA